MSVGCRSGVHWIRETVAPSTEPASARASTVFAVPGTSSSRTWPLAGECGEHEPDLLVLALDDRRDVLGETTDRRRRLCDDRVLTRLSLSSPSATSSVAVPSDVPVERLVDEPIGKLVVLPTHRSVRHRADRPGEPRRLRG